MIFISDDAVRWSARTRFRRPWRREGAALPKEIERG
jgi:hypothetical protein